MQSTTKKGKVNTARPAVHCSNPLIGIEPDPPIQKVRVTHTKEKTHTTPKKTGETFSHLFSSSSCPFLGLYHVPLIFRASCTEAQVLEDEWSDSGEKLIEREKGREGYGEVAILQEPPSPHSDKFWQSLGLASAPG